MGSVLENDMHTPSFQNCQKNMSVKMCNGLKRMNTFFSQEPFVRDEGGQASPSLKKNEVAPFFCMCFRRIWEKKTGKKFPQFFSWRTVFIFSEKKSVNGKMTPAFDLQKWTIQGYFWSPLIVDSRFYLAGINYQRWSNASSDSSFLLRLAGMNYQRLSIAFKELFPLIFHSYSWFAVMNYQR